MLQLSHSLGRYGGSRPYHRKRASHHSFKPSSVPFTVDGCTVIHAPVFVTCRKQCATEAGAPVKVSYSVASDCNTFLLHTPPLPFTEYCRMIRHPELLPAPVCCYEMLCDDTGRHPLLRGRLNGVWEGQTHLLHQQLGDPLPWDSISFTMK